MLLSLFLLIIIIIIITIILVEWFKHGRVDQTLYTDIMIQMQNTFENVVLG